jgi:hypothetical protein
MIPEKSKTAGWLLFVAAGASVPFFAGCATTPRTAAGRLQYPPAANSLREARSLRVPVEKRAADYLQVAAITAPPKQFTRLPI